MTKTPKLHSFRLGGSQIREVPHFRASAIDAKALFDALRIESPLECRSPGGFSLAGSRQPIADRHPCTAGGNEDDVAGFHFCLHRLAASLRRMARITNGFSA
jgi:hypothetical protein